MDAARRWFLTRLPIALLAVSFTAEAQPIGRVRIGVLLPVPATAVVRHLEALRGRLRELGYVEGQNLTLEVRWRTSADQELDRLAGDLVRSKVDLLVAWTTPAALAAKTGDDDNSDRYGLCR